jgi:ABC-2 type transport system permease protein
VIVENDRRIRVLNLSDLYATEYSYPNNVTYYMQVDSALTNALTQVTVETIPILSIASGSHGEMLSTDSLATFQALMTSNSFEIQTFDILTEDIPENTSIIFLPTPTTDYTDEELAKLDAFLDETKEGYRSVWVSFDAAQPSLPNFSAFLAEWGLEVPGQVIITDKQENRVSSKNKSYIISNLTENLDIGGEGDYGYFVTPQSRPINLLFDANDSIATYALAQTSEEAILNTVEEFIEDTEEKDQENEKEDKQGSVQTTVAIGRKSEKINGTYYDKSVVAFGSSIAFTSPYLSSNTFGNATYFVDLARYTCGVSDSSIGVTTKQVETNTLDITITTGARNAIGIGLFVIVIPLALIIAGVVVYLKRRHL